MNRLLFILLLLVPLTGCESAADRLRKTVHVELIGSNVNRELTPPRQILDLDGVNFSNKAIKAIKGTFVITDLFDKPLRSFKVVIDKPIQSQEHFYYSTSFDYNRLNAGHAALADKSITQVKTVWQPEKILFLDGSTLE